jgi:hypothetical protein
LNPAKVIGRVGDGDAATKSEPPTLTSEPPTLTAIG